MTLRNQNVPSAEEKQTLIPNVHEQVKIEKFSIWIKELAVYLGQFEGSYMSHSYSNRKYESIDSVDKYDKYILKKRKSNVAGDSFYRPKPNSLEFVCITGKNGDSKSPYVKALIENIFPIWIIHDIYPDSSYHGTYYEDEFLAYGSSDIPLQPYNFSRNDINKEISTLIDKIIEHNVPYSWRDDIKIPPVFATKLFNYSIKKLFSCDFGTKAYCVFWNLFLLAIDDDIYETQLSDVVELAHLLGFDEHMMRDWCRAVEYVLSGNHLSETCDLHCDTVEGAKFFLHSEDEDEK